MMKGDDAVSLSNSAASTARFAGAFARDTNFLRQALVGRRLRPISPTNRHAGRNRDVSPLGCADFSRLRFRAVSSLNFFACSHELGGQAAREIADVLKVSGVLHSSRMETINGAFYAVEYAEERRQ